MHLSAKQPQYRWVVLGLVWMSYLTVYLSRLSIGPLAPFLKAEFDLSNAQLGSLVSATAIFYTPILLVSGWAVDRFGVHRVISTGTLISGLGVISLFFASSYKIMFIILLFTGFGTGCIFPSAVKAVIIWFPLRERATAMGLNQSAVNIGGVLGAVTLPVIAVTLGWRFGFLFIGSFALMICLSCFTLYRDPLTDLFAIKDDSSRPESHKTSKERILELCRSRDIWMVSLAGLSLAIVEFSMMTHLVVYLKEVLMFGAVAAGGLLAVTEISGAFAKPLTGIISDRFFNGKRKIVFIFMAGTAALLCLILAIYGEHLGRLLYPFLAFMGFVAIGFGGLLVTMGGELGGKELAGMAAGINASLMIMGAIVGPPMFGYIVDQSGSFKDAWIVMALFATASLLLASFIREDRRRI